MARNIDESRWIGHGAEQEGFYGLLIGDIYGVTFTVVCWLGQGN